MKPKKKTEEPPSPSDLEGWKAIATQEGLSRLKPEDIVAAIQRIGPNGDQRLLSALISYMSDRLMRFIRPRVGRNQRNEGEDIVTRAHHQLIVAILTPNSADGKTMCRTFWPVVKTRLIDAIRAERLYARRSQPLESIAAPDDDAEETARALEPAEIVEQTAHVETLLNKISDPDKRKAFRLHMDGCPLAPGKGSTSIAQELGISPKTAGKWIDEITDFLKNELGEPQ